MEKSPWQKGGDGAAAVPFLRSLCRKENWERQEKRHCPRKGTFVGWRGRILGQKEHNERLREGKAWRRNWE